jgi:hypothetical protein
MTTLVIAMTPVRMAGSGTGANSLECELGKRVPFSWASRSLAESAAPSLNMQMGGLGSSRAKRLKSSLAMTGSPGKTFSFPSERDRGRGAQAPSRSGQVPPVLLACRSPRWVLHSRGMSAVLKGGRG